MKRLLTTAILVLTTTMFSFAYEFYLSTNRTFNEDEDAYVLFYKNYYNYNKHHSSPTLILYKMDDPTILLNKQYFSNGQMNISDKEMKELTVVKTMQIDYKGGYQQNINVGKLPSGAYIAEVIDGGNIARVPLIISHYAIITKKVDNKILAFFSDKNTGKALQGVKATAYISGVPVKASTVKNGISEFIINGNENSYYYTPIIGIKGDAIAVSQSYFYNYNYYGKDPTNHDYVFTDRSVYRPGQTVYFKGFIRKKDGFKYIIPKDSVVYKILDETYKEIASKKLPLEKDGSFDDSLLIDETLKLGVYYISASLLSASNQSNYYYYYYYNSNLTSFNIEEYKKPEYEVNVSFNKNQYTSGDTIKADVDAKYFFGSPVANADVTYKIVREEYYIPYYYFYRYWWWYQDYYNDYTSNKEVIKSGTGKINANGSFSVTAITNNLVEGRNYKYSVIVDVQDASRRTISGSETAIVASTAYNISAVTEKYYCGIDEDIVVLASARDYSKRPVQTKLTAKLYPYYYQNVSNPVMIVSDSTLAATGMTSLKLKAPKTGYYKIVIEGTDNNGKTTSTTCYSYVFDKSNNYYSWWNNQSTGGMQIITDKKVYNAGEKIKAIIYLPHSTDAMITLNNSSLAHYDTYTFAADKTNPDAGSFKEITFETDEKAYGKLGIDVAYMHDGQNYSSSEYLTIIPQNQYLNVELIFDKDQYKPGKTAYARVKVTDSKGNPVPDASVVLSTIDQSLYAMYPDNSKNIQQEFYESDNTFSQYSYYNYQNYFNVYNYSGGITPDAMEWRKKKLGDIFNKYAYLNNKEYYKLSELYSGNRTAITGYIIDYNTGKPIANAKIKIGKLNYTTNSNGYYALKGFKYNYVSISCSKDGYTTQIKNILLHNNYTTVLNMAVGKKDFTKTLYKNPQVVELINDTLEVEQQIEFFDMVDEDQVVVDVPAMAESTTAVGGAAMNATTLSKENNELIANSPMDKSKKGIDRDAGATMQAPAYKQAVVRSDFQDAIYWNPHLKTNVFGEATVRIELPDNLTTWRTSAKVITNDTKVGQSEIKITVRKELLVRMETPRFMTVGDVMLIATNIHNYLSTDKLVKVSMKADGVTLEGSTQEIKIAANSEKRIDWKVKANWPVNANLTIEALTDEESDAMTMDVPVQPSGLEMYVAKSTYLINSTEKTMDFNIPSSANLNNVTLEISTAPSVTAAILSSMDDLIGYPYGCVEQTMSRFLPNVVVANTLNGLGNDYVSDISASELTKMVAQGTKRLGELQHDDGGWGWWENDATHPFMTAYATNGLYLARKAGYHVNDEMYNKAIQKLQQMVKSKTADKPTISAYQMMVALNCGLKDLWKYKNIPEQTDAYQDALWLQAAVLANDKDVAENMAKRLEKSAIQEGTSNHWGAQKFHYQWEDDKVETTANAVKGLIMYDPNNELIAGAVQWLLNERKGKSWQNTRESAMTIYAFNELIKKEINPNFSLEVYANDAFIETIHVTDTDVYKKGKTIELKGATYLVSLGNLSFSKYNILAHGEVKIRLVLKGKGSAYVNGKLKYFVSNREEAEIAGQNNSFKVVRNYYKLTKKIDKSGKLTYVKTPIDKNEIQSGDDILVKTTVTANDQHEFVLIEDPIPAGCEFIRNTLGYVIEGESEYSGNPVNNSGYYRSYYNWNNWYTHKEYRNDKFAMTITNLPKGNYSYSYLLKAQIPGTFNVNPAVTMLMYYPEQRGFSDFGEMTILDKK